MSAVAVILVIAAGAVIWAPSVRHPAPRPPVPRPTTSLPLSAAVLTGTDTVHYKDVRSYGLASKLSLGTDTWSFTPKCATGPCSVNLIGAIGGSQFTATLRRSGAAYLGKATLKRGVVCGSVSFRSSLNIQVTVRTGSWAGGKWRAASWAGRLILYSPSTTHCRASRIKAGIYSNS